MSRHTNEQSTERHDSSGPSLGTVGFGTAIGVGIGSLLGAAIGDMPVGIVAGLGIGVSLAMALDYGRGRSGGGTS